MGDLRREVLEIMRRSGVPLRSKDIAEALNYKYSIPKIANALGLMKRDGLVVKFSIPDPRRYWQGQPVWASGAAWMLKIRDTKLMRTLRLEMRVLAERGQLTNRAKWTTSPFTDDMKQMIYDMEQRSA